MSIQKILKFQPMNQTGQLLNFTNEIKVKIQNNFSNYLIHRSILRQNILKQQGTRSTKTRSDVNGGGRKPWRQKGTGKARAGSRRSPLWKGGGVTFGPKPKDNNCKLNKKERRLALQTLLFNKKDSITVIDNLEKNFIKPKTAEFCKLCHNCNINLNSRILIIVSKKVHSLKLAMGNIKNIELISASSLNLLSLIKAKQVIVTTLALNELREIFNE